MWDGWIRRRVVWYLQKKKVTKWQAERSGECLRCGKCCGQCPALDTEKKVCRIYSIRPAICKAFPLTPDDLKNLKCGFRFKK
ncbi:MAG TPA: YkgJ family cysteine cluster protein [Methanothrix sp.]|nr:YkgJ family cysteine cluster protein [Methanothrix sp.]HQJ79558.1 YkgJ family cysteine cluster protein [Methanothrix sp.]